MRIAARVDKNQNSIVEALRSIGVSVRITSMVGKGFGDIVCGVMTPGGCRMNYIFEIKDGSKPPSQQLLTPQERAFFDSWKGQIDIIRSADEAVQFVSRVKIG